MTGRRILEFGGVVAGVVMIAFGIGALVMSVNARNTVSDGLELELIVGSADMSPTGIKKSIEEYGLQNVAVPSCDVPSSRSKAAATRAASRNTCAFTRSGRLVG